MRWAVALVLSCFILAISTWAVVNIPPSTESLTLGSHKVTQALMCPDQPGRCQPDDFVLVSLPDFPETQATQGRRHATYKVTFAADQKPDGLPVIYLPRASDSILVWANDTLISPDRNTPEYIHHNWNRPHYSPVPRDIFEKGDVTFTIHLQSYDFFSVFLYPFYIGRGETLEFASKVGLVKRVGMVRVAYTVTAFGALAVLCLWLTRRHNQSYLWLVVVALAACFIVANMIMPNILNQNLYWWAIWNSALIWLFYGLLRFSMLIYGLDYRYFARSLLLLSTFCSVVLFCLATPHYRTASELVGLFCGLMGLCALACHVWAWPRAKWWQRLHVPVFALAGGAAAADYVYAHIDPTLVRSHRGGFAFLILFGSLFLALIGHLARTLFQYDSLTRSMQDTIEKRTRELAAAQARVAEAEKAQALGDERRRIMLDLHDGVGGQLTNILSYLDRDEAADPVVHTSLEEALRDMALIIDSLEDTDDILVMLGSLRERLEPLLQRHGITMHWEVEDTPKLSSRSAKAALNTVRIVQESMTNAIKHANCQNIFVTIRSDCVMVRDDGCGFDPGRARRKAMFNSGLGLTGMQRRAEENDMTLSIESSHKGTAVIIGFRQSCIEPTSSSACYEHN